MMQDAWKSNLRYQQICVLVWFVKELLGTTMIQPLPSTNLNLDIFGTQIR